MKLSDDEIIERLLIKHGEQRPEVIAAVTVTLATLRTAEETFGPVVLQYILRSKLDDHGN